MLSGITILCFAASYAVAFGLELARALWRSLWLRWGALLFVIAGLLAQTLYLYTLAHREILEGVVFSRWYDWCLLAAWVVAAACLALWLRRPQTALGVFMLPMVLLLIAVAYPFRDAPHFARGDAQRVWGLLHGGTLLVGTTGVAIGFVVGLMYLVQSYRLKHKRPSATFKLPSLEWLQRMNEESLLISSFVLAIGLLTGVVLNAVKHAHNAAIVAWTEPTVWSSALLLVWLVAALTFNWLYKPARQGRKVAYLTMASFGFLAIVLGLVLYSQHGTTTATSRRVGQVCAVPPELAQVRNAWWDSLTRPTLQGRPTGGNLWRRTP
jgi:hypothetical protein